MTESSRRSPDVGAADVLLIDNLDSFTFNIADLLHRVLGRPPTVWRNDHPAVAGELSRFDAIVIGPGPGRPQTSGDLGISALALEQREVPVLGICLGHQGLAHLAGDDVVEMSAPMHGRVSSVVHDGSGILAGIPSPFQVVRYHSLEVIADASTLRPQAWASDDRCVMVLTDPDRRRYGVQFHPESVLTEYGEHLVGNFLRAAGVAADPGVEPAGQPGDDGPVALGDAPVAHQRPADRAARRVAIRAARLAGVVDIAGLAEVAMGSGSPAVWLDSSAGDRDGDQAVDQARFSILAVADGPWAAHLIHRVGDGTEVRYPGGRREHRDGQLLPRLQAWLDDWAVDDLTAHAGYPAPFRPGFVGYFGYELRAETARDAGAVPRADTPDASLLFVDRALVVDHVEDAVYAIWLESEEVAEEQQQWLKQMGALLDAHPARGTAAGGASPTFRPDDAAALAVAERGMHVGREQYLESVRRCQELIGAGESYEMCLTTGVTWPDSVPAEDEAALYRALREVSPVPFGAWLRTPEVTVLAASPERFVAVSADGGAQARPIKGTRGRGADLDADAGLRDELAASVKDRAENLMIVDLLRHDLHRVCRSGSVRVPELFAVETYATVHQLVSTVTGALADGMSAIDLLESCFPGGSMTGAPKVRTMTLLQEIEQEPRGVYSGALGWIGLNGAMDTSIVIRTLTLVDGQARFGIGGAVTTLSDPAEEYAEILHKARGMAVALAGVADGEVCGG